MNTTDIIKKMLENEHMSQTELSQKMGYSRLSSFNTLLRNGNVTTAKLLEICEILGYEMILRPVNGTDKAERTIKVGDSQWSMAMQEYQPKSKT